jgi:hypothetical protein
MIFILAISRDFEGLEGFTSQFAVIDAATLSTAPVISLPPYIRLRHTKEKAQLKVVPPKKSIPDHIHPTLSVKFPTPAEPFGLNVFTFIGELLHHENCIACDHLEINLVNDGFYIVVVQRPPRCKFLVEHGMGSWWYEDQEAALKRSDSVQGTVTRYVEDINWHL